MGGNEELRAEPQGGEPVVDAIGRRQWTDPGDVHEAHLHAVTGDVVEFTGELLEGHERDGRGVLRRFA